MAWKYLRREKTSKTSQAAESVPSLITQQDLTASRVEDSQLPDETSLQSSAKRESLSQDVDLVTALPKDPILSEDDEKFLQRIASDFEIPPLPPGKTIISDGGEATDVYSGADRIPLPMSPAEGEHAQFPDMSSVAASTSWTAKYWAFVPDRVIEATPNMTTLHLPPLPSLPSIPQLPSLPQLNMPQLSLFSRKASNKVSEESADTKSPLPEETTISGGEKSDEEEKKEQRDLSMILSNLNLSAINNRVIGVSKDSQRLLESFTIILKDIVNGVPTAYDDLEKLLTDRQAQLDKMYNSLPPFLQSLVQSVPTKISAFLAPQLVAAMTRAQERNVTAASTTGTTNAQKPASKSTQKRKMTSYIPSLRSLITQKGAVAAMLRSIISFLELRFPLLLAGTNVIMSLAVFLLLFVFWYCHKRGKESRLEQENVDEQLEASVDDLAEKLALPAPPENVNTTEDTTHVVEEALAATLEDKSVPAKARSTL